MTPEAQPPPDRETPPAKHRRPLWPWVLATIVLAVGSAVFSFWWPMHRAQRAIDFIEANGGPMFAEIHHPAWLSILGKDTFHPWFDRVTDFNLYDAPVDDEFLSDMHVFSDLESVSLNVAKASPDGIRSLSEFRRLERVNLEGNGNAVPIDWIGRTPQLEFVTLTNVSILDGDRQPVVESKSKTTYLSLVDVPLNEPDARAFVALSSLEWLDIIHLDSTPRFWEALSHHPSLKKIRVVSGKLSDHDLEQIGRIRSMEEFYLHGNLEAPEQGLQKLREAGVLVVVRQRM